jgi:hypothetical protein
VVTKFNNLKYRAKSPTSFDINRFSDFKVPILAIGSISKDKIFSMTSISDSLALSPRTFLHRHTFFVILTRGDTAYFYKAKGEYMYKDYKNDVKY